MDAIKCGSPRTQHVPLAGQHCETSLDQLDGLAHASVQTFTDLYRPFRLPKDESECILHILYGEMFIEMITPSDPLVGQSL